MVAALTYADDGDVADSPYPTRVLPGRPSARHCTVTGDGRRSATVGQPAQFIVEARDEFGNRSTHSAKSFFNIQSIIVNNCWEPPEAQWSYAQSVTNAAMTYQIRKVEHVKLMQVSAFSVKGLPSSQKEFCMLGCCSIISLQEQQLLGMFCCSCDSVDPEEHLPLEVMVKLAAVELPVMVEAQEDGCYTCSYQPISPGYHRLEILCNGLPLRGSPFSVKVSRS